MKIVPIFAEKLFSFHYEGEVLNEYDRLLTLWNDVFYLREFLNANKMDIKPGKSINQIARQILEDSYQIEDTLISIAEQPKGLLDMFFRPLYNNEYQQKQLSLRKGRERLLRLYAIRIDVNCFVITGGAIKLTRSMQDRWHTKLELVKLERAKAFLTDNGIFDSDSYFEFLII